MVYDSSLLLLPVAAAGITGSQLALIALIIAATVLMLISNARRRREGGPSPRAYARELTSRVKEERAVQTDLAEIMLQLQQVSREINAQLDAKFVRLERCIADADARIEGLDRLLRRVEGKPPLDVTIADDPPAAPQEATDRPPSDSVRQAIHTLADRGQSALEIARAVGRPVGEVELIVALGKTRSAKAHSEA